MSRANKVVIGILEVTRNTKSGNGSREGWRYEKFMISVDVSIKDQISNYNTFSNGLSRVVEMKMRRYIHNVRIHQEEFGETRSDVWTLPQWY